MKPETKSCQHRSGGRCLSCVVENIGTSVRELSQLDAERLADTGEIPWRPAPATEPGLYLYREGSLVESFDKWTLCVLFSWPIPEAGGGHRSELRMLTPPANLGNRPVPASGQFAGPIPIEGFTKGKYLSRAKAGG